MKFTFNGKEIVINHWLRYQLDSLIYNVKSDWDFVILITGDRKVRMGKSVLATQICAYLAYRLGTRYDCNDIYFDSKVMINDALKKQPYAINHYDEGREGLAAKKQFLDVQKDLIDFFNECGQLNQFFVIVLPDYFDLTEEIAVARSEILINVYRKDIKIEKDMYNEGAKIPIIQFERGHFEFFNSYDKSKLYDTARSMRRKSYGLVKARFVGNFPNMYAVDETEYRLKKKQALSDFEDRKKEEKMRKTDVIRDKIVANLSTTGFSSSEIAKELENKFGYVISKRAISLILERIRGSATQNG